jgi:1-acyl-sn-glycerol-3-phosphate acyltransferase
MHESFFARLGRRLLTVSLFHGLWALLVLSFPVALLVLILVDAACKQPMPRTRSLLFFLLYLSCELLGIYAALGAWVFTLGGLFVGSQRWLRLHFWMQRQFTDALFWSSVRIFSMRIHVEGAEHLHTRPFVMLIRHTSTADTVLASALLTNPHRVQLRYVLKRELLWDPCLDIFGQRLPNAFVGRGGVDSVHAIADVRALAKNLDQDSGVLIYPEGTRFTPEKLASLRARGVAEAQDFTHVLPPRPGGTLALLEQAAQSGTDIVFVDHVGFEGAGTFASFWAGGLVRKAVKVRVRRAACAEIPTETEARLQWLHAQWQHTNAWVKAETEAL